jgi:transposase
MSYQRSTLPIRSGSSSTKFANTGKREDLRVFIGEYFRVCQFFVDEIWDMEKVPKLLPREITERADSWLNARGLQAAGKQASGIVRGTKKKDEQRRYVHGQLVASGRFKQARKLQRSIDAHPISKPELETVNPELDSRFITIDTKGTKGFDLWVTISGFGRGMEIILPLRKNRQLNEMASLGQLKGGVRVSEKRVTFNFGAEFPEEQTDGETVGLDIGVKETFACSTGQTSPIDPHGWTTEKICEKINRKVPGSNGFQRACRHRESHVNWTLKRINLDGVAILRMEDLTGLKKSPVSRQVRRWVYPLVRTAVEEACIRHGVRVEHVDPTYSSQRCSQCGWTRKSNRHGQRFKCKSCGFAADADLNASVNLATDLPPMGGERRKKLNRVGFFWLSSGQEHMVPDVK